jgi:hypothetical protein
VIFKEALGVGQHQETSQKGRASLKNGKKNNKKGIPTASLSSSSVHRASQKLFPSSQICRALLASYSLSPAFSRSWQPSHPPHVATEGRADVVAGGMAAIAGTRSAAIAGDSLRVVPDGKPHEGKGALPRSSRSRQPRRVQRPPPQDPANGALGGGASRAGGSASGAVSWRRG